MRPIPENNLAYPILITWNTGATGSGFALGAMNTNYFVTAKHCLFAQDGSLLGDKLTLLCQTAILSDDTFGIFEVSIREVEAAGNLFKHPTHDVAGFKLSNIVSHEDGSLEFDPLPGIKIVELGNSPLVILKADEFVSFIDEVLIASDIFIYGYPVSLGLQHSPQFEYNKPLLRKGIVANVNKKQGTIILDAPVYYGNSGGPVVQVFHDAKNTRHHVIGVVSQFIPYTENWVNQSNNIIHTEVSNSGYSVAVSMNYVFEMFGIPLK